MLALHAPAPAKRGSCLHTLLHADLQSARGFHRKCGKRLDTYGVRAAGPAFLFPELILSLLILIWGQPWVTQGHTRETKNAPRGGQGLRPKSRAEPKIDRVPRPASSVATGNRKRDAQKGNLPETPPLPLLPHKGRNARKTINLLLLKYHSPPQAGSPTPPPRPQGCELTHSLRANLLLQSLLSHFQH